METEELLEAIDYGNVDVKVEGIFVDSMGGKNPVYVTESKGGVKLQFINSSNQETLESFDSLLSSIYDELENEDYDGEVYDPASRNQIYWELVDENSNGTLIK
jgi:hypothetical protein